MTISSDSTRVNNNAVQQYINIVGKKLEVSTPNLPELLANNPTSTNISNDNNSIENSPAFIFRLIDKIQSKLGANTPIVDKNLNHDQILDVLDYAKAQGQINDKDPITLINCDTHSDIFSDSKISSETIANWVNSAVKNYNIKDVYWVIPDYIMNNPKYADTIFKRQYSENQQAFLGNEHPDKVDYKKSKIIQTLYMDEKTGELYSESRIDGLNSKYKKYGMEDRHIDKSKFKPINIHMCSKEQLPQFKDKKNVVLSIDADYFANSGYHTTEQIGNTPSDKELYQTISDFDSIMTKKINPEVLSLTMSPGYTSENSFGKISEYFDNLIKNSKTGKDALQKYTRTD